MEPDLIEIANKISEWEEKLVAPLQLTPVDVSDIKSRHPNNPMLQRYFIFKRLMDQGGDP